MKTLPCPPSRRSWLPRLLAATLAAAIVPGPPPAHAQGAALTTLHSFTSVGDHDGAQPVAALSVAADGSFYGVTEFGGSNNVQNGGFGTIFRVTPAGAVSILHSFAGSDGASPRSTLTLGADGNFYGSTYGGGNEGTLFKVNAAGTVTTLHDFAGTGDGSYPLGRLVRGADGNFYGTTFYTSGFGGGAGNGTVFKVTPAGALTTLHTFQDVEGADPVGLVAAGGGSFYGVAEYGGQFGNGTVFKINSAGQFTKVHDFDTEGKAPAAPLILATDGNFYGTTSDSGENNAGIAFRMTPAGALTVLHVFTGGADGKTPLGALLQAADGDFYGTTSAGGTGGLGTVFRLSPAGNLTTLYAFTGGANGGRPAAALVQTGNGSLYGTSGGGNSDYGTVFRVTLAPVLVDASASGHTGQPFSYQIKASNTPYAYTATGLSPGLVLDPKTGVVSGTPTQAGTFAVNVTATNLGGVASAVLTLAITVPPVDITAIHILSPPTNINIVQGETIALEVAVEARPGTLKKVVLDVFNAPGTAASDLVLGTSSVGRTGAKWTPATLGDFFLRIRATDTTGATPFFQIPIHVVPSPAPPPNSLLLSGLNGKSFPAGSSIPLVALTTDAAGQPLTDVKFYLNGVLIPPAAAPGIEGVHRRDAGDSPFSQALLTVDQLVEDALLTVAGTDSHGVTTVSPGATIRISPGTADALACSITAPTTDQTLTPGSRATATVAAANTAGTVSQVEFFVDDRSMGVVKAAPYAFAFSLPAAREYALTAIATDGQGASKASLPVIVTAALPTVTATAGGDGMAVEGTRNGRIVVRRTGDLGAALTVRYKVKGAAKSGVDYKPVTGTVTIPAGAAQAKIKIKPINDNVHEGPRVAKVKLLSGTDSNYTLGSPIVAKIQIIDND